MRILLLNAHIQTAVVGIADVCRIQGDVAELRKRALNLQIPRPQEIRRYLIDVFVRGGRQMVAEGSEVAYIQQEFAGKLMLDVETCLIEIAGRAVWVEEVDRGGRTVAHWDRAESRRQIGGCRGLNCRQTSRQVKSRRHAVVRR